MSPIQFLGQPVHDRICRSLIVVDPLTWRPLGWVAVGTHHLLVARGLRCPDVAPDSRRLQKVNIEALLPLIIMAGGLPLSLGHVTVLEVAEQV